MSKSWRPATQLVHGGTTRSQHGETAEAIFLTQGFVYDTSAAAEARFKGETDGFIYARYGSPTNDMFEKRMCMLEGAEDALGFASGKAAGFEADDFLAAAVAAEEKRGGTALVASGDRDAFQLASERTTILHPVKAGEIARIGPAEVRERYGVDPGQVPDFIALRGDPSDKLPGVKGVGEKTAASLLQRYPDLEAMLADGKFENQADDLRLYRRIATMVPTAPIPPLPDMSPTWGKASALAKEWELNNLAERLAQLAKA